MHRRKVEDLRGHRLTQNRRSSKYMSSDLTSVAREASKVLSERRANIIASSRRRYSVPLPGSTKGKQHTLVQEPRQKLDYEPSMLSHEVDVHDDEGLSEEESEDTQEFWKELCDFDDYDDADMVESGHDKYIYRSTDDETDSGVEVCGSPMAELDDYDIEMAKAFGEPVETVSKRKRASISTSELRTADLSDQADQNEKRRKIELQINASEVPAPVIREKASKHQRDELQPNDLWIRSSTPAAVFEAALTPEALEAPDEQSSGASELSALDLEILGEEPGKSE